MAEPAGASRAYRQTPLYPNVTVSSEGLVVAIHEAAASHAIDWPCVADDSTFDGFVYQTREFLEAWFATMGAARQARGFLVVVADRATGRPMIWLPLAVEREFGCSVLRFPDAGMADYNAPILQRGSDFPITAAIWDAILHGLPQVDLIDFTKMPETIWNRPNPLLRVGPVVQNDEGFFVPIVGSLDAYLADPARKSRVGTLKRLFRKLQRAGSVTIGTVEEPGAVEEARAFLEHHKAEQYRRSFGINEFDRPGVRAFLERLCSPNMIGRLSRMVVLKIDGRIIGAQLTLLTPRRQQGFMTTFDPGHHGGASPGRQVQLHLIERAYEEQREVLDLGHGDNAHKHPWVTASVRLYSLSQARSWRGRAYLAARNLRRRLPRQASLRVRTLLRGPASGRGKGS